MEAKTIQQMQDTFFELYQSASEGSYFSPGRLNLIGEHIDYNGGFVLPAAITLGTLGLVRLRTDKTINCYSANFKEEGVYTFSLEELEFASKDKWSNYVKGVVKYLIEAGHDISCGFDLLIYGTIPNGAGLSSSASLELLIGVMLTHEFNLEIDRLSLVKIGQKVENKFLGLNTGIMDQFSIGFGEEDHALYLDVNTLNYELIPAVFKDYVILIMNTNKRRELTESKYNERRSESDEVLRQLQEYLLIESLGELSDDSLDQHFSKINDPTLQKRARHIVRENNRTKLAKDYLASGQLNEFGQLMNESHISLRDDYDVTGIELDTLVEAAWEQPEVIGARMTGAGMGGCAIALVKMDEADQVMEQIDKAYTYKIGFSPSFYLAQIGSGAHKMS